jgi:hypothetical protein
MSQENYNVFVPSTSPELKNIADCAVSNLIPEKSKQQYDKCYNDFKERCNKNNVKTVSENVEAHAEHTGWHWCYEVSEIGTFFEKKVSWLSGEKV